MLKLKHNNNRVGKYNVMAPFMHIAYIDDNV